MEGNEAFVKRGNGGGEESGKTLTSIRGSGRDEKGS